MHEFGVPAALATMYLSQKGIVVARTTDFMILFLFSIGITKGKVRQTEQPLSRSSFNSRAKEAC
jgi:arginine/lysine/ornithine decarboxylase